MGREPSGGLLKKVGIGIGLLLVVPMLLVAIVGVRTMSPLTDARESLSELEERLGEDARYVPTPDGAIPEARMELFLALRDYQWWVPTNLNLPTRYTNVNAQPPPRGQSASSPKVGAACGLAANGYQTPATSEVPSAAR